MQEGAKLTIAATPIGNLSDVSERLISCLKNVDAIYCEETRATRVLINHVGVEKKLTSLHAHNEKQTVARVIDRIKAGENICYLSEAGTPGVSDPGAFLVSACLDANLTVCAIPGPSAVSTAIAVSGYASTGYLFLGFLARKGKERLKQVTIMAESELPVVFFESAKRVETTLSDLLEHLGADRRLTVCRELTKIHETVARKRLEEWLVSPPTYKGEFTLVLAPADEIEREQQIKRRFDVLSTKTSLATEEIYQVLGLEFDTSPKRIRYKLES